MSQQDAPAGVAWGAGDGEEAVEFADDVFERADVGRAFAGVEAHAQRNFVVAQALSDERGALFLTRRESLAAQLLEQILQHVRVDEGFIALNY